MKYSENQRMFDETYLRKADEAAEGSGMFASMATKHYLSLISKEGRKRIRCSKGMHLYLGQRPHKSKNLIVFDRMPK